MAAAMILGFDKHRIAITEPENMIGKNLDEAWNKYGNNNGIPCNFFWNTNWHYDEVSFELDNIYNLNFLLDSDYIIIKQKYKYKRKIVIWEF